MIVAEILFTFALIVGIVCLFLVPKLKKWENKTKYMFNTICTTFILLCEIIVLLVRMLNERSWWVQAILIFLWSTALVLSIITQILLNKKQRENKEKENS